MDFSGRLGPQTAEFVALKVSELPEVWLQPVPQEALEHAARKVDVPAANLQAYTVVELPDFPWAWRYEAWHRSKFGDDPSYVRVLLTARDNIRGEEDATARRRVAADAFRALVETGKPPPFFSRVFAFRDWIPSLKRAADRGSSLR